MRIGRRAPLLDRATEAFLRLALCLTLLAGPAAQTALAASAATRSPDETRLALFCGDAGQEGGPIALCDHCLLCAIAIAPAPEVPLLAPPARLARPEPAPRRAALRVANRSPWRARGPPPGAL